MDADDLQEAKVYVGTYKKYNEGSIFGKWLDLADYTDKEEFLQDCAELHEDEEDPEFMFQDWEYIPD
ncbi:MAG TPA: antirestriction protein, partial [Dysgonomonas sp.]|nr:antirestriction protein [Dysgonomonas sp.]